MGIVLYRYRPLATPIRRREIVPPIDMWRDGGDYDDGHMVEEGVCQISNSLRSLGGI